MIRKQQDPLAQYIAGQQTSPFGPHGPALFGKINQEIGDRLADETAHRTINDLGYPFLALGLILVGLDVLREQQFTYNTLLPLIVFGAFGIILLVSGLTMLPRARKKQSKHKH